MPRVSASRGRLEAVNGTKLVFILVGGAFATVLIFQALNQFT
ncbi:MAG TPA: hypothetical protein PKD75_10070 [Tepidiformaceae bacterium]|nr:hypothetical protein [Tepidiformaceae bacterium]